MKQLWIRSQDGTKLLKAKNFEISFTDIFCKDQSVGHFKTKQDALRVLDMIENRLLHASSTEEIGYFNIPGPE